MAYQPVAATALVELVYSAGGETCENTLYFRHGPTAWTPTELDQLNTALIVWWTAEMAPLTSPDVSLVRADATDLSDQFGAKVVNPIVGGVPGTNGSSMLPNNATFCTTFTTGLRGRAFRGRNFFVGVSESVATGNAVSSTWAADLLSAYNGLIGVGFLPSGVTWVVVTRVVNHVVQMPTALTNPVVAPVHADLFVDSQRRRLAGRGV